MHGTRLAATLTIGATLALAGVNAQTQPAPGEPGAQQAAPAPTSATETPTQASERVAQEQEIQRNERLAKLAESRRLLANGQSARTLAEFGPLGTYQGASGTVTVDTSNNAVMEATILATRSLDEIGYQLGDRLAEVVRGAAVAPPSPSTGTALPSDRTARCAEVTANRPDRRPSLVKPVVVVAAGGATLTDQADGFMIRTAALGRELCAALARNDTAAGQHARPVVPGQSVEEKDGGALPAIAAAVDTVARLFRADYKIYGIAVTEDEKLLSRSVALRFLNARPRLPNPVVMPELFPPDPNDEANPAVRRLIVLDGLRSEALGRLAKAADPRMTSAVSAYDKALEGLLASDGTQAPLIGLVLRQSKIRQMLDSGAYLVVTDIQKMGGTSYDKKNFFTLLGGMPYFVSGSAAASYAVQDTDTDAVLDAINLQVSGGYHRVNALPRAFDPPRRR